jgi:hypothetical protein
MSVRPLPAFTVIYLVAALFYVLAVIGLRQARKAKHHERATSYFERASTKSHHRV